MEETVGVILTGMKSDVGGVEGERIWIWSDDDGVASRVVDEIVGVESEVAWISVWMSTMVVVPMVGSTGLEVLDPSVLMGVDRLREG